MRACLRREAQLVNTGVPSCASNGKRLDAGPVGGARTGRRLTNWQKTCRLRLADGQGGVKGTSGSTSISVLLPDLACALVSLSMREDIKAKPNQQSPPKPNSPWYGVDWKKGNSEIAKKLGVTPATVSHRRRRYAPETRAHRWHKGQVVDWKKKQPNRILAKEVGCSASTIAQWRQQQSPETVRRKRVRFRCEICGRWRRMIKPEFESRKICFNCRRSSASGDKVSRQ